MIDLRHRKLLFFHSLFIFVVVLLSFLFFRQGSHLTTFMALLIISVVANVIFLRLYALPATEEIEETLAKKDIALKEQKKVFELETLKYKQLLDSLEDPVCIFNRKLVIIYANNAFISLFNISDKKFPLPLIEATRNLEFQEFVESAVNVYSTSKKIYFSFTPLQEVNKAFFDLKMFPVENGENYLCLLHDVTERKMADQIREDFVANFSHEVRTPLTILNGQMQNLKIELQKENLLEKYSVPITKIENNSRRLINLFNDLLRLSSVETKKELKKEKVNIEEMLNFLGQDLLLNYPGKRIEFDFDLKQKELLVDYPLFEQVLINIIDNAIKYSGESGKIKITSQRDLNWDHLVITDSGTGIPEEQQHRIFERFYRGDSSRSKEIEGTGLGLSIVKHIIQKHDGRIKVSSRPDAGTTFTLSLPTH